MRLIKWFIGLVFLLTLLLSLAPIAGKYYAIYWLEKEGFQAEIDTVSLNVFTRKLTMSGIEISRDNEPGARIDLLEANIKSSSLKQKELALRKLKIQGFKIVFNTLNPSIESITAPAQRFIDQYMPEWRFNVISGLAEQVELCRSGRTTGGDPLSQCLSVSSLSLRDATLANTNNGWQFETPSSLHLQGVYFKDDIDGSSLFYLGDGQFNNIRANKSERSIGQASFEKFHLVERRGDETARLKAPYQTQLDQLVINDIVETRNDRERHVSLGLVDITALRQTLHRDSNAVLVVLERLRSIFPLLDDSIAGDVGEDKADGSKAESIPTNIGVMKTRLIDGRVAWLDDSVEPPAQESLGGLSFELGPFSSKQANGRTAITFAAKLGDIGDVDIQGHVALFAEQPDLELKGRISGLDMKKLSAYTDHAFAEKAIAGRLDTQFDAVSQTGQVRGAAAMRLSDLKTLGGGNRGGTLSLQNSFDRLKSKNQSVDFEFDYNLQIDNFSTLGEALGGKIKRVLSDLAQGKTPASKTSPIIKPLISERLKYNPSNEALLGAQASRFKSILAKAKANPSKVLILCPVSTGGEWAALYRQGRLLKSWEQVPSVERDHLLNVSKKRVKVIQQEMTSQFSGARYKLCESQLDLAEDGPSFLAVELR